MKKIVILLLFLNTFNLTAQNQGISNWWYLGYGSFWGPPFGHTKINFSTGSPVYISDSLEMNIARTAANISDASGNLLFYTNGYYIADASHDTMMNGNNISPTGFQTIAPYGLTVPQACLILPYPASSNLYYLFHNTLDNAPNYIKSHYIYKSLIDMNLNGGLGGVVSKNNILLQDTLNPGKLTACKHANGRDWWVVCQQESSNVYFSFLVTPTGILGPYSQGIGNPRTTSAGMACFAPDGSKYAYFHSEFLSNGGLDIMDFDRCSGLFSNNLSVAIHPSSGFGGGVAFSANSRFLYTANVEQVYQYDMYSSDIPNSQIVVAQWDSFYSPSPPFAAVFDNMQLAPDGKIYVSTGNGTFHLHVINYPDSSGMDCDFVQHAIQFQFYYSNGLPNHPNYFLGCDTTSSCVCLTTGLSPDNINISTQIKVFPNPTTGFFAIQYDVNENKGQLKVFDVLGKIVLEEYIPPWSQFKEVDISNLNKGVYYVRMLWNGKQGISKLIKD